MNAAPLAPTPGETFLEYRVRCGWRRSAYLAREIRVSISTISRMEHGQFFPGAARSLSRLWGITIDAIAELVENSGRIR